MSEKLMFLATEDWFVRSHFLPLLRRARADGYDVVVVARNSGALDGEGVRVIDAPFPRGSLNPWRLRRQVRDLRALLARERPAIVHAIALRPIVLALLADIGGVVFALTGRGYLAAGRAPWVGAMRWWVRDLLRRALERPGRVLLVENQADRAWIEASRTLPADRVLISPGAGVDTSVFTPAPPPPSPPIIVGLASRLIWSKGIDIAVAAIRQLRAQGMAIELRVAGAADPDNPERVPDAELAAWRATPGVTLLGRVADINAFWAGCHIACLPSRGGEGLPRSLLEAAACGRPMVTTRTPGCADFVLEGETGLIVPIDDPSALAGALRRLAEDADARARMGEAARARVLAGYTETHAADVAARAWRSLRSADA